MGCAQGCVFPISSGLVGVKLVSHLEQLQFCTGSTLVHTTTCAYVRIYLLDKFQDNKGAELKGSISGFKIAR